jgi:GNAT superfamily N-acetyltransferase
MPFTVRNATRDEIVQLGRIELEAATRFNSESVVADLSKDTLPLAVLQRAEENSMLWVACTAGRELIGFLAAEVLDESLHITEMSVLPAHGRQGVGSALLLAARAHSRHTGLNGVTLTTFAAIPWNAPFYFKNGFSEVPASQVRPGLAARIKHERELGLVNRTAMWHSGA